ncbi:MAG: bifunctional serine/threonine-protein kinase/formylglycine-generating enzyme family protein [Chthoniobacter sp.]|uniref:bifunctional serine/threonine-protein kinase/formylglycine-generating enzyme family protein n=1 Tax=Chthoniobacter sp. TaxID=2510640 RepID=UPI0032A22090
MARARHATRKTCRPHRRFRPLLFMIGSDHRLALPVGHRFAEFRIVKVLGQGGFGITYLAQDTLLNIEVAIKELLPRDFATRVEGVTVVPKRPSDAESFAWAKQRFINEARILASLRHENIVHVYRFLECHGTAYMVMEFVHGQNLLEWMGKHRKPSEQMLHAILFPLLDGLDCVHGKNVLHRDISPENILITSENRPMLLDFGAARTTVDKSKTLTGVVKPGYSPIEQYQTDSPQGPYTDIYALAGVMIHAITGGVPPVSIDRCGEADWFQPMARRYRGKYGETFLRALDEAFRVMSGERPQSVAAWRQMLAGDFGKGKSKPVRPPAAEKQPTRRQPKSVPPAPPALAKRKGVLWLIVLAALAAVGGGASLYYAIMATPKTTDGSAVADKVTVTDVVPREGAWKGGEYVNSLGMRFVPVPASKVLFSIHQTRRADYAAYARSHAGVNAEWETATTLNKEPVGREPTHPVVMVSWNEANAFCQWLSDTETKKSGQSVVYRLPTWSEWRAARGNDKYPWGDENPPPNGSGNYADLAARRVFGANFVIIPNYDDGYATTSPAGNFRPNKAGLFDFGSNVQEWSADQDLGSGERLILSASWKDAAADALSCREKPQYHESPDSRRPFIGFRCVLVSPGK